jgi:hypothetical protein
MIPVESYSLSIRKIYKEYYSDVTVGEYVILMEAVFDYLEDLSIMMYSDEDWWLEEYSVHRLWIK